MHLCSARSRAHHGERASDPPPCSLLNDVPAAPPSVDSHRIPVPFRDHQASHSAFRGNPRRDLRPFKCATRRTLLSRLIDGSDGATPFTSLGLRVLLEPHRAPTAGGRIEVRSQRSSSEAGRRAKRHRSAFRVRRVVELESLKGRSWSPAPGPHRLEGAVSSVIQVARGYPHGAGRPSAPQSPARTATVVRAFSLRPAPSRPRGVDGVEFGAQQSR